MYPVHKGSKEYRRRQASFIDAVVDRVGARASHALFGQIPDELWPILDAGLSELPHAERDALVSAVLRAQATLRDHATKAAFASGRAQYCAPPDVQGILEYQKHVIKINKAVTYP